MWMESPFTSIETSLKVGPFATEAEARAELVRCQVESPMDVLSGLSRVPGVEFQDVHLEEPVFEALE